jgi:hypothetical protein
MITLGAYENAQNMRQKIFPCPSSNRLPISGLTDFNARLLDDAIGVKEVTLELSSLRKYFSGSGKPVVNQPEIANN